MKFMKCPKCGSEGSVNKYEFRPYGILPIQTLYKGVCPACGFCSHQSSNEKQAADWFVNGITRNPLFDQWREAEERCHAN